MDLTPGSKQNKTDPNLPTVKAPAQQHPTVRPTVFCKVCAAALPRGVGRCAICGAPRGRNTPIHPPEIVREPTAPPKETSPASFRKNRAFMSRAAFMLALTLLLSGLGVGVFQYLSFQNLLDHYTAKDAILYQQGSNALNLRLGTTNETILLTDRFQSSTTTLRAKSSGDSRFLGYLNNQRNSTSGSYGTFFLLDLLTLSPTSATSSAGLKVTEQSVIDFYFLEESEELLYLTTEGELYLCDYRGLVRIFGSISLSSTLLDTEVKGIGMVAGNRILYYKGKNVTSTSYQTNLDTHSGNSFDLYSLSPLEPNQSPKLVASNVYSVLDTTKDFSRIYYTKRTHTPPLVQYEIFQYDNTPDTANKSLVSNVWHIVSANATNEQIIYLSPQQNMLRFEDLFDDDLAQSDEINQRLETASEPDIPLQEEAVVDELLPSEEAPDAPLTEQKQRQLRDNFRAYLRSNIRDAKLEIYLSFDLYSLRSGQATKLGGPIFNWAEPSELVVTDSQNSALLFVESSPDQIIKPKISSLTSDDIELQLQTPFELLPYLVKHLPDSLCYVSTAVDGEQRIFSEPGSRFISNFSVQEPHNDIYFISYPEYDEITGTLYQIPVTNFVADKVIYIDEGVEDVIGIMGGEYPGILYQTASRDDPPFRNLYLSSGNTVRDIGINTSLSDFVIITGENRDNVLFFRDFNSLSQTGELYLQQKDEEILVASSVSEILSSNSQEFLLVKREPNSFRSLYEYKNGELSLIDERLGGYVLFSEKEDGIRS